MAIFCLQLFRISPSLDHFVSRAEGIWMSVFPQTHRHSMVSRMPSLGELQRVLAVCCSHTTPSWKRVKRLRDLAFSGKSFNCGFPTLESRFLLKNRNMSGVVLKNRKQVSPSKSMSQSFCDWACEFLKVLEILGMIFLLCNIKVPEYANLTGFQLTKNPLFKVIWIG